MRIFRLQADVAAVARSGKLRQIRYPLVLGEEAPAAGAQIVLDEVASYGKTSRIGVFRVQLVSTQRLDDISDEDIVLSGFENWSRFAAHWSQQHGAGAKSWEVNPEVWVICIEGAPGGE